jgi:hypothetical protein
MCPFPSYAQTVVHGALLVLANPMFLNKSKAITATSCGVSERYLFLRQASHIRTHGQQ